MERITACRKNKKLTLKRLFIVCRGNQIVQCILIMQSLTHCTYTVRFLPGLGSILRSVVVEMMAIIWASLLFAFNCITLNT